MPRHGGNMGVLRYVSWIVLAVVVPLAALQAARGAPAAAAAVLLAPLYVKGAINVVDVIWLSLTGHPLIRNERPWPTLAAEAEAAYRRDLEVSLRYDRPRACPKLFDTMRSRQILQASVDRWLVRSLRPPGVVANHDRRPIRRVVGATPSA